MIGLRRRPQYGVSNSRVLNNNNNIAQFHFILFPSSNNIFENVIVKIHIHTHAARACAHEYRYAIHIIEYGDSEFGCTL